MNAVRALNFIRIQTRETTLNHSETFHSNNQSNRILIMNKVVLLGGICSTLFCSCTGTNTPDGNEATTNATQYAKSAEVPVSLNGYTLIMNNRGATYTILGNGPLNEVIAQKLENYDSNKNRVWNACSSEGLISQVDFSKNMWKIGRNSGNYTCEKLGKDKLYVVLEADDDCLYESIHMLLKFNTSYAGYAVYTGEEAIYKNIQFQLKK